MNRKAALIRVRTSIRAGGFKWNHPVRTSHALEGTRSTPRDGGLRLRTGVRAGDGSQFHKDDTPERPTGGGGFINNHAVKLRSAA